MSRVCLAFKAYDVHELLCHALADAAGLYAAAGLTVTLLDSTFLPDEALPENTFHAACGAALASFVAGHERRVVFVACDRPMFWLYGAPGIDSLDALAQARVATFADNAPPATMLARLLREQQLAPGLLPCRDDTARLGLLCSGSVDAALISSHYLPGEVLARGVQLLAFLGDTQRIPSTGLAVSEALYREQPQLVARMVRIHREALALVFEQDDRLLRVVLQKAFGKPAQGLDDAVRVIRQCYNPDGRSEEGLLQQAIDAMASAMGRESRAANELYRFGWP